MDKLNEPMLKVCGECGYISTDELKENQSCCPNSNWLPLRVFVEQWRNRKDELEEMIKLIADSERIVSREYATSLIKRDEYRNALYEIRTIALSGYISGHWEKVIEITTKLLK